MGSGRQVVLLEGVGESMRQIAIYGKGGIGKSTISQNVAAALGRSGRRPIVVGCDPKADCTRLLLGGQIQSTVLDRLREADGGEIDLGCIIREGAFGVACVEAGGPEPGVGCAGRGIITAIELLERYGVYEKSFDYVLYDVLGDVVCGGFAMPIREGKAQEIYLVTSGEFMSLYAANNIAKGIARYSRQSQVRVGGVICNCRNVSGEEAIVERFARRMGTRVLHVVPRSATAQEAEIACKTVVEYAPESPLAKVYGELATELSNNDRFSVPTPLSRTELEGLFADA